jgi:hypothetical protein
MAVRKRRRQGKFRSPHLLPLPDDDQVGQWTRSELERMGAAFTEAMMHAFEGGAGMVHSPPNRQRGVSPFGQGWTTRRARQTSQPI